MNQNQINRISAHCDIASNKAFAWNPVYVDIVENRFHQKVGHIVSDGYEHTEWDFYPVEKMRKASRLDYEGRRMQKASGKSYRRVVRSKSLETVVPKWVGKFHTMNIIDFDERTK